MQSLTNTAWGQAEKKPFQKSRWKEKEEAKGVVVLWVVRWGEQLVDSGDATEQLVDTNAIQCSL